jgi:ankyrin repeat protein
VTNKPRPRKLREHPDLDQLRRQAKELLEAFRAGETEASADVAAHYRGADPAKFALHDAQLVLARSYGFDSWPKLKAYVDGLTVERLAQFVRANDLEQARAMLARRPELANMQMSYGNEHRPLHYAVMGRLAEMTRLLMQLGADARCGIHPHRDETTPLVIARERGYDEIAAIIEEEEQRRREGAPAGSTQDELTEAIADGDDERAIAMLEADLSRAHATDRDGSTALHIASAVRNPRLVGWLVEHGAAVDRRTRNGRTPLDLAAAGRRSFDAADFARVAALLRHAGAAMTPRAAAALGEVEWLRARHGEGSLVNPVTWEAGGLLTIAVRHNRADVLALLLEFSFDPNEQARFGEGEHVHYTQGQPLWQCAALDRRDLAEILLKGGANPNAEVDSSGTTVHGAYSHGNMQMVELLRHYGGVVRADTAAIYRQTQLARQMLADDARGALAANATSGRPLAEDLLDFACSGGAPEIVRMALERIDWPRDDKRWSFFLMRSLDFWNHIPWLYAGHKDLDRGTYIECFRQVLARCDANVRGGFGRTALHEVAAIGDHVTDEEAAPFAIALLDAGAHTDVRDEIFRSTPLGWACRWGRLSVVKVLLDRGADAVEADAEPWAQPASWAEKMGHSGILALLRSRLSGPQRPAS